MRWRVLLAFSGFMLCSGPLPAQDPERLDVSSSKLDPTQAATSPASMTPNGAEWQESVRRATSERKPILVFSHPEPCAPDARIDPCEEFAEITSHPAMQRRLSNGGVRTG